MARERNGAATALVASAVLAPVELPPEAEVTDHGDGTATVSVPGPSPEEWLSRVAALNTELDEVKASAALLADELTLERTRTESLRAELAKVVEERDAAERNAMRDAAELASLRTALANQRDAFDAAWAERERELAEPPPVTAHRYRAVGSLRCHLRGAPITVADGAMIPDGVDLSTLPSDAFEEAR